MSDQFQDHHKQIDRDEKSVHQIIEEIEQEMVKLTQLLSDRTSDGHCN